MAVAFALCLAVGSAAVGRDGPEATVPFEPSRTLVLSQHGDVVLFAFPDRLANEPLPNLNYVTVTVRGTEGLAVNTGEWFIRDDVKWIDGRADAQPPVRGWLITWTEAGTVYSLSSESRDLSDLLRVAGSLR